jgi:hypothetical protein
MTAKRHQRGDIKIEPGRGIKIVPEANEEQLNEKQLVDYREHRAEFIDWLLTKWKNPEKREGYSPDSVYGTAYRCTRFDRWVWNRVDRYSIPPRPEHADEYMDDVVAYRDVSTATKGKTEEALIRAVRDVVYSRVSDTTRHETPDEMSGAASRRLGFDSIHPDNPDTVLYRFEPRVAEGGRATISLGFFGSSDDGAVAREKDRVRGVVAAHADRLDDYETSDEANPNSNLVYQVFEIRDREPDEEFDDTVVEELTRLVDEGWGYLRHLFVMSTGQ